MKAGKFSVLMNVYHGDNPVWFRAAVNSILNQTVKPDEVVLVVDGPVPEALDAVIREYEAPEVFNVIRLPENRGLGNARRVGLEACRNELVAMMDADDLSVPDRFEKQLAKFAEDESLAVVGGNISEFMGTVDNMVGCRVVPQTHEELAAYLKKRCPLNHVTVMEKKSQVDKAGGYQNWLYNEDYYLWVRMYLAGMRFANVQEILVNVRVGTEMYKRRGGWRYFVSETKLQGYMRKHGVINLPTWVVNVAKRVIVQLLMPNSLRGFVYRKFARTQNHD